MIRHGVTGGAKICLDCPYPKCVLDFGKDKTALQFVERMKRNDAIVAMRQKKNSREIGRVFGLSRSQVNRIVAMNEKLSQLCEKEIANEC